MPRRPGPVVLLSDFGTRDAYVGILKAVLLGVAPAARIVDLTHEIPPQDVAAGRRVLEAALPYLPRNAVVVAVVDPGVGGARAAVGVESGGRFFLGPDNGLLGFLEPERIVGLEDPRWFRHPISKTFHGRDVFAPAAGHLCRGVDLDRFGPRRKRLADPPRSRTGRVVDVDRFGNLITDIPASALPGPDATVRVRRATVRGLSDTYASAKPGALLALIGSTGHLEISVNQGDASRRTGARKGDPVRVARGGR
jgi:hypothetical protein